MMFTLIQSVTKRWRALNGSNTLPDVVQRIALVDRPRFPRTPNWGVFIPPPRRRPRSPGRRQRSRSGCLGEIEPPARSTLYIRGCGPGLSRNDPRLSRNDVAELLPRRHNTVHFMEYSRCSSLGSAGRLPTAWSNPLQLGWIGPVGAVFLWSTAERGASGYATITSLVGRAEVGAERCCFPSDILETTEIASKSPQE